MMVSISAAVSAFADYLLLILPGMVLLGIAFWLSRADRDPALRIIVLILGFILMRDAMTPVGFWEFGLAGDSLVPWLRMSDNPFILIGFGLGSLSLVWATLRDPRLNQLMTWGRATPSTILLGLGGGVLAAAPVLLLSSHLPMEHRGGEVALSVLPALLFMALTGNLGEEVFFRGYLQGHLEKRLSPLRSALLSGVLFAGCHVYLASTVTSVGWPLLAFVLWEGLICAFLRMKRGVIPAALAHGIAIFLLASGLL